MAKTKLIIKNNIKKFLPKDIRLSIKVAEALDKVVEEKLKKAVERAKANKRTTVLPQDL